MEALLIINRQHGKEPFLKFLHETEFKPSDFEDDVPPGSFNIVEITQDEWDRSQYLADNNPESEILYNNNSSTARFFIKRTFGTYFDWQIG